MFKIYLLELHNRISLYEYLHGFIYIAIFCIQKMRNIGNNYNILYIYHTKLFNKNSTQILRECRNNLS